MNAVKQDVEKSRVEKIRTIAKYYGYDVQSRRCIEEMAQLTQAINKYWRTDLQYGKKIDKPCGKYLPSDSDEYYDLIEEIADVQIMLEQMKFFLAVQHDIDQIIDDRLNWEMEVIEDEIE